MMILYEVTQRENVREKRVVMEHFTKVFKENAFVIFHCSFLFLLMSEKGLCVYGKKLIIYVLQWNWVNLRYIEFLVSYTSIARFI